MDPRFNFLRSAGDQVDVTLPFEPLEKRGNIAMHYWPAKRGADVPPEELTLFILGNPGVLDFYTPFLNLLREKIPDSHAIICTSHVGGDPRFKGPAVPLDIPQQLELKIETVEALKKSLKAWAAESGSPEPRLTLMGHSIGGWLVTEVMRRVDVHAGYLLFPTLGWLANTWNGRTLWPLFHRPVRPLLPLITRLARPFIPTLASIIGLPPTTVSFIRSPDTVRCVLAMARSEMDCLGRPELNWYYSQRDKPAGEGVYGVWSAGTLDGWVGEDGPLIQSALGPKRVVELEGVPHAFCLIEKDYVKVADVVARWINGGKPNGKI